MTDVAALQRLSDEWELLDAKLSPRAPFTSPLWNLLWWKHFREDRGFVRDELYAHAVRNERGDLVGVAPMMLTRRPAAGPLSTRELHFFGADPNLTEMRGPVCQAADEAEVIAALALHFEALAMDWDWLEWSGVRSGGAAENSLHKGRGTLWLRDVQDYYLRLPATWEEFRQGLSRNIKESLRKCYNSLKRDLHSFMFRAVEDPSEMAAALDRFFALHAARALEAGSIRHPNVFQNLRTRAFFTEYCQQLAARGQLRIFQIEIAGEVVASRVGFILGEELYLYYSGYDPAWGRYSVMTTALAEILKWAIENGFKIVNLSTGNDVSKSRWHPVEAATKSGVQRSSRLKGRLAFSAYQMLIRHSRPGTLIGLCIAGMRRGRS